MIQIEDLRERIAVYHKAERWNLRLKIAGIIVVILSAFGIVAAIDMRAEEATAAPDSRLTVDLADCPPLTTESLPFVSFHIRITADDQPVVTGCTRYAKRSYIPRPTR